MTDNEIIKAFEHLVKNANNHIPITGKMLLEDVLDVLNRQKAEIERLKNQKCLYAFDGEFKDCIKADCFYRKKEDEVKSEAVKEFVDGFNSMLANFDDYDTLHIYEIKTRIDSLKEMVGDDNA